MIGDRDPVGVPQEIVQHVTGTAEWRLGVDDPLVAKQGAQPRGKGALVGEALEVARQPEGSGVKRVPKTGEDFAAKDATQDLDREEEGRAGVHPPRAVGERPPAGTTQCACGWCNSVWPHVWRTLRKPSAAPRCFGVRATSSSVAALAWQSRS